MVIKTETCAFSEQKIYPGHGSRFVRKDGQLMIFLSSKCAALYHLRKKAAKLTWSLAWRRSNKKASVETSSRRRRGRAVVVQRGFTGASFDDIRKKKAARSTAGKAAGAKTVKARVKVSKAEKRASRRMGGAKGGKAAAAHAGKGR
mmetsp:Transcript_105087/g.226669  ORF Transcript_105087/g.226669 Transcript_105087/m.226669 type:complete len:146 (+) Transcript_105087:17-454(+)|eukprot:CAMPEP_0116946654 /NCGR_PEP_ID=MMETSP0467-20121206/37134_1 /TAXON_ID=283647 /ORGANISM="Mesodinium pulex, Strain SPMC105" /LENGTH=145 /DNA_ID=CAMNT_0004630513 /DNA_START=17 /DNA_END=454 /DNA_ORIENTATION=+